MEKVIITKCEPIFGGKAHGCTFADGRQATAWGDKVDGGLLMQAYASGKEVEVDLKYYNSKGKQGFNIVGFMSDVGADTYDKYAKPVVETIKDAGPQAKLMSQKDISIVSQCMMKCMYYNRSPENAKEVYDTYHDFVKMLEQNV